MTLRTVGDLLEALDGIDPATPLRHAQQPRYPFEWTIGGVELVEDLAENSPVAGLPPRRGRRGAGVGPMSMTTVDRLIADTPRPSTPAEVHELDQLMAWTQHLLRSEAIDPDDYLQLRAFMAAHLLLAARPDLREEIAFGVGVLAQRLQPEEMKG